ncbi:hypothetical protein [Ferruginibacter sp.]
MQQQDQLWHLLAASLAGEAQPAELARLQALIEADESIKDIVDTISAYWEQTGKVHKHEIETAWEKLAWKIQ